MEAMGNKCKVIKGIVIFQAELNILMAYLTEHN